MNRISREAAARTGRADHTEARDRLLESARRLEGYAVGRAVEDAPPDLPRWLLAEQDLLTGHPWHPMTKSRDGLDDALDAQYSPEARGRFAVRWYAADPEVAAFDGAGLDVPAVMRGLAGAAAAQAPEGWLLVPAHPWQAAQLSNRLGAADLLDRGLLRELGPAGGIWWATSSLRTVARPDAQVMLKLSMGLRVTNSRRENTRGEGLLAVHTARLVDAGLGRALAAAHPAFGIIADRGWLGVDGDGPVGLETVLREAPIAPDADIRCTGALLDPRPDLSRPVVADAVARAAAATGGRRGHGRQPARPRRRPQEGLAATFMAKFDAHEGSSCHFHVSLRGGDGRSAFAGGGTWGESALLRHAVAGQLALLPELTLLFAPTLNSYKRLRSGGSPVHAAWGPDNRLTALRLTGCGQSLRVEHRVPGADAHPHLTLAGILLAFRHGLEHRLTLPEPTRGAPAQDAPRLPATLAAAADLLDASETARKGLGDALVDSLVAAAHAEWDASLAVVTDWERARGFERR